MKKSAFTRSLELAKMAAQIGLKEARSGDLKSRLEQAKIIAEGLSQMKGAAMKAGQLLSIEIGDYFPKEAQEILSVLQNAAAPESAKDIQRTLEQELGARYFDELKQFDVVSTASASIGQVHRARFRDQDVAIKVQYRGVAESVDSDIAILKKIAGALCLLTGRQMDLNPLFEEFKLVLTQEVDYLKEADYQMRYFKNIETINGRNAFYYRVPQVFTELSTERVLVMGWQEGVTLKKWIEKNPSREKREHVAHALLNLYCHEFFDWGLVQTDPNFANFLVHEINNNIEIVLLDFGATREYEKEFVRSYIELLRVAATGDDAQLIKESVRFGLIDQRESEAGFQAFTKLMRVAIRPFFNQNGELSKTGSTFQFADENYAQLSRQVVRDLTSALKYSPPPYKLIFLHRKLGGLFAILKNLNIEMDVTEYWRRMVGTI